MSSLTIASLKRIDRDQLYQLLKATPNAAAAAAAASSSSPSSSDPSSAPAPPQQLAIIDVRDSDHIGGHIVRSTHIPSSSLDWRMPELVRTLRDVPTVVFHCALSQQRGPSAALRYLRERARLLGEDEGEEVQEGGVLADGEVGTGAEGEGGKRRRQEVWVLEGGFVRWQEKYGEDNTVTEAYQKDIWEFGY